MTISYDAFIPWTAYNRALFANLKKNQPQIIIRISRHLGAGRGTLHSWSEFAIAAEVQGVSLKTINAIRRSI